MKRRMFISLLALTAIFFIMIGRLFWVQVLTREHYSSRAVNLVANSVAQRTEGIVLDDGRGDFYDRSQRPLTGQLIKALAVFPFKESWAGHNESVNRLAEIIHIPADDAVRWLSEVKRPSFWPDRDQLPLQLSDLQARQIEALHIPGVLPVNYRLRYGGDEVARHVIGFIGENPQRIKQLFTAQLRSGELTLKSRIGAAGLEKTFEPYLRGLGDTSISQFTDADNRPMEGLKTRIITPRNSLYPLKVITTLDQDIQRKIESLLDRLNLQEGAVVVLDRNNADVIAMVSRPQFDPRSVELQKGDWGNRALKAIAPGSIFKTVVAAAALEEGVARPQEVFQCNGELGRYGFSCWKQGGHGKITFEQAFAESCNITFAEIIKRISSKDLVRYARMLGLTTQVGWHGNAPDQPDFQQFAGEEAGRVFAASTPTDDEGVRVQTAIGQRDVAMSPLQAANLVVALLNGGEVFSPRIVKEIRYQNDRLFFAFPVHHSNVGGGRISAYSTNMLLHWMREVIVSGTGKSLQQTIWQVGGKSGTAVVNTSRGRTENQWFIGYGPLVQPRYAVSVVAQNRPANSRNAAIEVFRGVMDILADASKGGIIE